MNKLTLDCINQIKNWFKENGNESTKAIISISGDSSSIVATKLLVEALGYNRVIGVIMFNGTDNIEDSIHICEILGIENYTINIKNMYKELTEQLRKVTPNGVKFPSAEYNSTANNQISLTVLSGINSLLPNCKICVTNNSINSSEIFNPTKGLTTSDIETIGLDTGLPQYLVK